MAPINATEFKRRVKNCKPIILLDVREEIEYATYNVGGKNIPLSTMPGSIAQLEYNKTDEIIVICKIGLRSETACKLLNRFGYENVRNLTGGLIALQRLDQ